MFEYKDLSEPQPFSDKEMLEGELTAVVSAFQKRSGRRVVSIIAKTIENIDGETRTYYVRVELA